MTTLHIALQDGFKDHLVTITVDGRVVYDRQRVTTDLRLSRADACDVQLAAPEARVEVVIEPGPLRGSLQLDAVATPYLNVSVDPQGRIALVPSAQLPRYM